ncbi:isochorismatase family protein [Enterococcus dongliensis]|uniref:isochorismatase family protein n=1 Tax=Enterococcus dongliensis TaxID=2559925 RepID=UPI002891686A|nr:isochorismatase family protein [Enterococcus dongliensis]MDT2641151.1 isochorismatase family protein [Enterococcus dongliensis]MDT2675314.1 isochorismatase family protein [Enterococcus dongliensis]
MLVIVDMQRRILDMTDKNYVQGAQALIPKLKTRLEKARESREFVLFTKDIPIEYKNKAEELPKLKIIEELSPLPNEVVFKKNYYTLPPESLVEIRKLAEKNKDLNGIEVAGAELSLCVLANILALQSIFPEEDFYLNSELVTGNKFNKVTLEMLQDFNVRV